MHIYIGHYNPFVLHSEMPELEKAFLDMKDRLTNMQVKKWDNDTYITCILFYHQVPADMDATVAVMKDNMDKLLELFKVTSDRIKESNNK